ncbi:hypothetical protein ACT80S_05200 [Ramlibacter sp. MAHUQ-53]|uniref:hypothetical protein n=1 Tax=unclassified Ramlibacter TaxID=2617605 RepID=UPI0036253AAC
MTDSDRPAPPVIGKVHAQRLREVYRSAGWPCQDGVELELLAAGLLQRVRSDGGHETLRLTDEGIALVARQMASNRAAFDAHEALVERVAQQAARAGRIAWRGLKLRAQVPGDAPDALKWVLAKPDVFSIRNTSVAEYVEPVVHEVKVRRADLLGDLRRPAKRAAYLHLGECWYVLGQDAKGRPIGEPDEVPAECGVIMATGDRLQVARPATPHPRSGLPFTVWMALAKATPLELPGQAEAQGVLVPLDDGG